MTQEIAYLIAINVPIAQYRSGLARFGRSHNVDVHVLNTLLLILISIILPYGVSIIQMSLQSARTAGLKSSSPLQGYY